MRFQVSADLSYQFDSPAEVLLLLEAAGGGDQVVTAESLWISTDPTVTRLDDVETGERRVAFHAEGLVQIK